MFYSYYLNGTSAPNTCDKYIINQDKENEKKMLHLVFDATIDFMHPKSDLKGHIIYVYIQLILYLQGKLI